MGKCKANERGGLDSSRHSIHSFHSKLGKGLFWNEVLKWFGLGLRQLCLAPGCFSVH